MCAAGKLPRRSKEATLATLKRDPGKEKIGHAIALASAAVALKMEGTVIRNARIALVGIETRPWRARACAAHGACHLGTGPPGRHNVFKIDLAARVVACQRRSVARASAARRNRSLPNTAPTDTLPPWPAHRLSDIRPESQLVTDLGACHRPMTR
ncbi:hypothetical protein [uncultured Paracoccus sp.]|uniref:hypothetical protein n=1 Tax=uncultured Paracoccus sp. TaxID=189685 RepID=UPI00338ED746